MELASAARPSITSGYRRSGAASLEENHHESGYPGIRRRGQGAGRGFNAHGYEVMLGTRDAAKLAE
jgi:hypothetical protein